jgi:hypothetical protein
LTVLASRNASCLSSDGGRRLSDDTDPRLLLLPLPLLLLLLLLTLISWPRQL